MECAASMLRFLRLHAKYALVGGRRRRLFLPCAELRVLFAAEVVGAAVRAWAVVEAMGEVDVVRGPMWSYSLTNSRL